MKKVIICLLMAVLLLTGCSSEPEAREPYTVTQDGFTLTIDPQRRTITHGETLYTYTASETNVSIYYPNGAVYSQHYYLQEDSVATLISGGWSSGDLDQIQEAEQLYLDGDTLVYAVADERPEPEDGSSIGVILAAIGMIGGGMLTIINAEKIAYWRVARWVKDAEPSDSAIYASVIGGIVLIGFGLVLLLLCLLAS